MMGSGSRPWVRAHRNQGLRMHGVESEAFGSSLDVWTFGTYSTGMVMAMAVPIAHVIMISKPLQMIDPNIAGTIRASFI
jgi:hypothetical protein